MEATPRPPETLADVFSQQQNWLDLRHLKPLTWMGVGLIQAGTISLTARAPYVQSRAAYAQSTGRRSTRQLANDRIDVHALYGPLSQQACTAWGTQVLYLALDPSTVGKTYGVVRISLVYRGRAVPLVWTVLDHPSSRVAYAVDKELLDEVAQWLPVRCHVVFSADRGFAYTRLMAHLVRWGWCWRMHIKGSCQIYPAGWRCGKVNRLPLCPGQAVFWHHLDISQQWYGPVHLAMGRPQDGEEHWVVVSDEPTELNTFEEQGLRFDIEANGLDDKSNGLQ